MLDSIYNAIYTERDFKKADTFLNQGLKSNGPFYLLGYYICQTIANTNNEKEIGRLLTQGAPAFFQEYIEQTTKSPLEKFPGFSPVIQERIEISL